MNRELWTNRRDYFAGMLREEAADEDRWAASHQHKPAARLEWAANDAATLRALADQIAALQPPGEEVAQPPHDTPARTVYVFGEPVARTETGCGCSGDYADPDCKYGCWDRVAPQDTATPDRPSAAQIAQNLRNWKPPHGENSRYA